jgi:hypothetical protein
MTRKKELIIEGTIESVDYKNIKNIKLDYFPLDSNNKVTLQFSYGDDYYITVKSEFSYKGYVFNKKHKEGKFICEFKTQGEVLNKIPHYWD